MLGELGRATLVTTIAGLSAVGAAAILAQADDSIRRAREAQTQVAR